MRCGHENSLNLGGRCILLFELALNFKFFPLGIFFIVVLLLSKKIIIDHGQIFKCLVLVDLKLKIEKTTSHLSMGRKS